MYFFALITDMKSILQYHINFPRNRFIYKSTCSQQVYRCSQADNPKQKPYSSPSVMILSVF
jgi:hypothetical protein